MPRKKTENESADGMPVVKSKSKPADPETLKSDLEDYPGGLPINLDRELSEGQTLREVLSEHVKETLDLELKNQEERVEKLSLWNKNYLMQKDEKSYPWVGAANLCMPISLSSTDTTFVRAYDSIFNKRKIWLFRPNKPGFEDASREIEDMFDWYQRHILKLREKSKPALMQTVKTGTGILFVVHEEKKRTIYRYATDLELEDKETKKYKLQGTDAKAVKDVKTVFSGPNVYPISREDFVVSSDAANVEDAYMCGHRFYLRRSQMELRVKQGAYSERGVNTIISPDKHDETKEDRVEAQKKELSKTSYEEPYEFWRLYLKYDVDGDGEEDDIVVVIHRQTGNIVRAIYNESFFGSRPYVIFKFYPVEYCFDGRGTCEILEHIQAEIDTIHNQRRDRQSTIISPPILVKEGCGVDGFKTEPGRIFKTTENPEDLIREVKLGDVYPSTEREEDRLIAMGNQAVGITQEVMGISTSERPVAGETIARLEEANKKFKFGHDNIRAGFRDLAYKLLEYFAQYAPTYEYEVGETGEVKTVRVDFPYDDIKLGFNVELESSSEVLNQEIRGQRNLQFYQIQSDYMTKLAGMGQVMVNPSVPKAFINLLVQAAAISRKIMVRVAEDYDVKDAEELVLDLNKAVNSQQILATPSPPPMPPGGPQGPGGPPQGGPPPGPGGPPPGPPRGPGRPIRPPMMPTQGPPRM